MYFKVFYIREFELKCQTSQRSLFYFVWIIFTVSNWIKLFQFEIQIQEMLGSGAADASVRTTDLRSSFVDRMRRSDQGKGLKKQSPMQKERLTRMRVLLMDEKGTWFVFGYKGVTGAAHETLGSIEQIWKTHLESRVQDKLVQIWEKVKNVFFLVNCNKTVLSKNEISLMKNSILYYLPII